MRRYSEPAWERAMKVQEVILRAMAKRITWWQAAELPRGKPTARSKNPLPVPHLRQRPSREGPL
jgi:hypothetical protein